MIWSDWISPFQAVVLAVVTGLITLYTQRRLQRLRDQEVRIREAEGRLHDQRRRIYLAVLDPYIEVIALLGQGRPFAEANKRLASVEHRKAAFELKLVGTDPVVRAFNHFARHIIDAKKEKDIDTPEELLRRWAVLLLAIRKSVADSATSITETEMLLDWIEDIGRIFPSAPVPPTFQDRRNAGDSPTLARSDALTVRS